MQPATRPSFAARRKTFHDGFVYIRHERTDEGRYVPAKRQAKTLAFWEQLKGIVDQFQKIGSRGLAYRAEAAGIIVKTEAEFERVQRALRDMRDEGVIPYEKIVDSSRVRRRIWSVESFEDASENILEQYKYDYWFEQPMHVEIWCEKETLAPLIEPICDEYGVYFCPVRGFDSRSNIWKNAESLKAVKKPIRIFYLGDHDPSGWWIAKTTESTLAEFGVDAEVHQIATLPKQIIAWGLHGGHAKKTDSRYPAFVDAFGSDLAVETEAISPDYLEQLVRGAIRSCIDWERWEHAERIEQAQRQTTESIMKVWTQLKPGTTISLNHKEDPEPPPAPPKVTDLLDIALSMRPTGEPMFFPGQRVRHKVFGDGVVVSSTPTVNEEKLDEVVVVSFTGKGVKRLVASWAKLEKLT